ncbi:glycoside hydrolase superfamily [Rhodocollybia butyracea]|uniref:Glycoside hydrolase superfamily n=1 Tax=Rhodocollybia butyracea TaxID=206335 RepID=A0A9P5QAX6_9AGAR|nr:glycoside hydrolase superfamily [Rhodocollybia butyracea]
MFAIRFIYALSLLGLFCLNNVLSAPILVRRPRSISSSPALPPRSTTSFSPPYFVVYTDAGPDPAPPVEDIQGVNVVIMSFLLSTGAADMAHNWAIMGKDAQSAIKDKYKAAGIKLLVSAFGSTEKPTTSGTNPTELAQTMATWVKENQVDGIDIDWEDNDAMNKADGSAETWLIEFTKELRNQLPQGQYILTHAPQAPWLSTGTQWNGKAYVQVNQEVGSMIDWYNVQWYSQGPGEYETCDKLINDSGSSNPNSALFQVVEHGFDVQKLVIGKPATDTSATNGYIDPATLAGCLPQAIQKGWSAGIMVWEYQAGVMDFFSTVRAAFPEGAPSIDAGSSSAAASAPDSTGSSAAASAPDATSSPTATSVSDTAPTTTSVPSPNGSSAGKCKCKSPNGQPHNR